MRKQESFRKHYFFPGGKTLAAVAMVILSAGCAGVNERLVKPGDQADLHFTCRLKNGEVAASSHQDIGKDPLIPKAPIFLPRDQDFPLTVEARNPSEDQGTLPTRDFEGEILERLSYSILGRKIGVKENVELRAERYPDRTPEDHILKIAKVRRREKEIRLAPDEYTRRTGKVPEIGQDFVNYDPEFKGRIEKVSAEEVYIRFPSEPGKEIKTPFGKGVVRESADRWEIEIDAQNEKLVRTGGLVGRIVDVNDRLITIDYGHPFGGEPLFCVLMIEAVNPPQPEKKKGE